MKLPSFTVWWAKKPAWLINGVLIVALALAALKANSRLEQLVDLDGTDETQYLAIGLEMPAKGLPDARREVFFAPLYSAWYLGLAQFQPERVRLPGLNFRILAVLLAVALYGLLRRAGCPATPSALAAFFLIVHNLSLEPTTRSTHFAVFWLAAGLWVALGATTRVQQCCALGLGAAFAAFARPEYAVLAIVLLASAASLYGLRRFRQKRGDWKVLVGALIVAGGLAFWFGPPMGAGNDRSFLAFSQHFSAGYLRRHPSDLDPWWDYPAVVAQVFGGSETLAQAWRKNPREFLIHVSSNLQVMLARIVPVSLSHRNFLLPEGHRWRTAESGLLAGLFALLVVAGRRRMETNLRWFWGQFPLALLFMVGAVGLAVAGIVLTSTADRYFFPLVFLGLFFFVALLGRTAAPDETDRFAANPLWLGCFALMLVGMTPASSYRDQNITSTRSVLAELARHSFREGTGFVEALGMKRLEIFLQPQLQFVHPVQKTGSFSQFIASHHIGVIHLTPYLRDTRNFASDPEWREFLAAPAKFGFSGISLPFQETLYVRESALAPLQAPR